MKSELSSLDIHYLVKEFRILIDGKIDKVFMDKDNFVFQFHVPSIGKKLLRVMLPGFIFLTEHKEEFPHPGRFCMTLRKYLGGARLRKVEQKGFERILDFVFEKKEGFFHLIIELFSKGNLILVKEDYTIIVAKDYQKWSQRTIRGGIAYAFPEEKPDPKQMDFDGFSKVFEGSSRESIVKTLAIEFSLGGRYSEELCLISGVDKDKKTLSEKEKQVLFDNLMPLFDKEISAFAYEGKDITPFSFNTLSSEKSIGYDSFNQAIDAIIGTAFEEKEKKVVLSKFDKKRSSLEKIQKMQENQILGFQKSIEENQEKGDIIYKNYAILDDIIKEIAKARKKYSWKEIKEKLNGHKMIKEIREKDGKLLIEISDV